MTNKTGTMKGYKGLPMEGPIARWYAKNTRTDTGRFGPTTRQVAANVPPGGRVLEVAPGPGYLSIALAKLGDFRVTGLDISKTFVEIARQNAREAGVDVEFRLGEAAHIPFDEGTFDFVVCTAAFKNFTEPVGALAEMYRVLKPGGKALIVDLRRDASPAGIDQEVRNMKLKPIDSLFTKWTFHMMLLKSAYTADEIQRFVSQAGIPKCKILQDGIGMEIWLEK